MVIEFTLWVKATTLTIPALLTLHAAYPDGTSNETTIIIPDGTYDYKPVTGRLF
ncbi:MAG TPA: hypothetical protein VHL11_12635 [Phototrophicaceae bacterium]|jgi:hypothetical protein|nr:hypothetical protein [Phototrophicaceae bacterium]